MKRRSSIPLKMDEQQEAEGRRIQVRESLRMAVREEGLSLAVVSEQAGAFPSSS